MIIQKNKKILVLRYNEYKNYDFIKEHMKILKNQGCVWMLKLGRQIPDQSLRSVIEESGVVIFKSPKKAGNRYFIAQFNEFCNGRMENSEFYPNYYHEMRKENYEVSLNGTWLRVIDIAEAPMEVIEQLRLVKNQKKLIDVVGVTRTSMLYVTSSNDCEV